jgi:integral membrane protein (TIGR00529 family)
VRPLLKTKINYWFRHIWEYWWPVYPGVLLAIEITRLPMWKFILLQLPLSFLSVTAGYIFLLRKVQNASYSLEGKESFRFLKFLKMIFPVMIIIIAIGIRISFPVVASLNKYIPMSIGVLAAIIILQVMKPLAAPVWKKIIFSKRTLMLVILVTAVRLYGAFIEADLPDGLSLVETMRMELNAIGIPLLAIIIIIPFIAGLATGLAIGFVGASFPIVINIIGMDPQAGIHLATTLLAYGAGYMGMMLSPVHVCFIVTNEYFKTRLVKSLAGLIKPVLFILAGTLVVYVVIRFVLFPG